MSLHFINQSRRTRQMSFSKSQNQTRATNAGDSKQKTLKDDCRLLSTIFIFCHSREYDLMEFFQHEHQSFPATLSDNGNHHSCQKSQLATILERHVTPPDTEPEASFIILDGSALINALPSRISKTFQEYAVLEVVPKVQAYILHEKKWCLTYTGLLV